MKRLAGKTALITGGNSGIGYESARAFIAEGAQVFLTGRDQEKINKAVAELGPQATGFQSDAGKISDIATPVEQVEPLVDGLDILFANAGIGRATPLGSTSEEVFDEIFAVNVKGLFFTVQGFLPLLRKGSSVILNASVGAYNGSPANTGYAASKAAVRSMARNMSADLAERGIRVNALSPGPTSTPIWERTGASQDIIETLHGRLTKSIPAGRLGKSEEIARAALFLASDDSSFMLGSEVIVDGGLTQLPGGAPAYR